MYSKLIAGQWFLFLLIAGYLQSACSLSEVNLDLSTGQMKPIQYPERYPANYQWRWILPNSKFPNSVLLIYVHTVNMKNGDGGCTGEITIGSEGSFCSKPATNCRLYGVSAERIDFKRIKATFRGEKCKAWLIKENPIQSIAVQTYGASPEKVHVGKKFMLTYRYIKLPNTVNGSTNTNDTSLPQNGNLKKQDMTPFIAAIVVLVVLLLVILFSASIFIFHRLQKKSRYTSGQQTANGGGNVENLGNRTYATIAPGNEQNNQSTNDGVNANTYADIPVTPADLHAVSRPQYVMAQDIPQVRDHRSQTVPDFYSVQSTSTRSPYVMAAEVPSSSQADKRRNKTQSSKSFAGR